MLTPRKILDCLEGSAFVNTVQRRISDMFGDILITLPRLTSSNDGFSEVMADVLSS